MLSSKAWDRWTLWQEFGNMKTSTMNIKLILLGCLAVLVGFYACASQSTSTSGNGFLSDYSKLKKNPRHAGSKIYFNPETPVKNYSRFIVNPVQVRLSSLGKNRRTDSGKLQEISQYAHQQFIAALQNGGYQVVTSPGPGTMIIRSALTEVAPTDLRSRSILMNVSLGGASIEVEFVDALSGEIIAEVMESQRGTHTKVASDLNEYSNARDVIDRWAVRLVQWLDREHGKK
jgi:hypothetical protein